MLNKRNNACKIDHHLCKKYFEKWFYLFQIYLQNFLETVDFRVDTAKWFIKHTIHNNYS